MHEAEERLGEHKKALEEERANHRAKARRTGLQPHQPSRPETGLVCLVCLVWLVLLVLLDSMTM